MTVIDDKVTLFAIDDLQHIKEELLRKGAGNYRINILGNFTAHEIVSTLRNLSEDIKIDLYLPRHIADGKLTHFRNCTSLQSISIPDTITLFNSFCGCTSLFNFRVDPRNKFLSTDVTGRMLLSKDGKTLLSYPSAHGNVSIPKGITHIGQGAFSGCTALQSVSIPGSVTHIEQGAFSDCTTLQSVFIPGSVTHIEQGAFSDCTALQSVSIPDSVTHIGPFAFSHCTALQSIFIPDGVTCIRYFTFSGCTALQSVSIPDGVTHIEWNAFNGCTALQSVSIPDGVTHIERDAFSGCTALQSVSIPDSITHIEQGTFSGCTALQSVFIPDSVTHIGPYAFSGCNKLHKFTVDDGNKAFSTDDTGSILMSKNGKTLIAYPSVSQSVSIPNSITKIELSAFVNNSSIVQTIYATDEDEVVLPWNLYHTTLEKFMVEENNQFFSTDPTGRMLLSKDGTTLLLYPSASGSVTIPDSITAIRPYVFAFCTSLTNIQLPNSINTIGRGAFTGCTSLETVTIFGSKIVPGGTGIEQSSFSNCTSLKEISIPKGIITIGECAFMHCSSLEKINIPEGVTTIEPYAFLSCTSLKNIQLPNSINTIINQKKDCRGNVFSDDNVFLYCTSLETVTTFGNKLTSGGTGIHGVPFSECSSLKSVSIPGSITHIEIKAFSSLQSISIPSSVISIGNCTRTQYDSTMLLENFMVDENNQFFSTDPTGRMLLSKDGTTLLLYPSASGSVTIPDSITAIGPYAFAFCTSLTNIQFPNSINTIGRGAFTGCTSLETVTIFGSKIVPGGTGIEQSSFSNCTSLKDISIPESITQIGEKAFSGCRTLINVQLPNNINTIGCKAFAECSALENMTTFGEKSISGGAGIQEHAFSGCTFLATVSIPEGVTSIGALAFSGCIFLATVSIPEGVTSIGAFAFSGCISLATIPIPESVTSIGHNAFSDCITLTNIQLPNSIIFIGSYAFSGCTRLKNVTTFGNKTLIKGMEIGEESLAERDLQRSQGIFSSCPNLTSVRIPDSVISIGEYCIVSNTGTFQGCPSLESVFIPNTIKYIDGKTFRHCGKLSSVIFEDTTHWYLCHVRDKCFINTIDLTDATINAKILKSITEDWTYLVKKNQLAHLDQSEAL